MEQRTWADAFLLAYGALVIIFGMLIAWSIAESWPAPAAEFARMGFVAVLVLIVLRVGQIGQTSKLVREESETRRVLEETVAALYLRTTMEGTSTRLTSVPGQGRGPRFNPVNGSDR